MKNGAKIISDSVRLFIGKSGKAERTKDSVYHRPDFILSAPDGIEVSHNTRCLIPR